MLNSCQIMGRLGQDPEVRQTQSGKPVANFTIACDRDFKNAEGKHETDWIRCVCFGATADFVGRFLQKGRAVCVNGRLQVRKWTDSNGQQRESWQATSISQTVRTVTGRHKEVIRRKPPDISYGEVIIWRQTKLL